MFLLDTPLRFPSLGPRLGDLATVSGYGYLTTIATPRNACVTSRYSYSTPPSSPPWQMDAHLSLVSVVIALLLFTVAGASFCSGNQLYLFVYRLYVTLLCLCATARCGVVSQQEDGEWSYECEQGDMRLEGRVVDAWVLHVGGGVIGIEPGTVAWCGLSLWERLDVVGVVRTRARHSSVLDFDPVDA